MQRRDPAEFLARMTAALAGAVLALPLSTSAAGAAGSEAKAPTPVLVELFTSEGCSSCPPADELMKSLVAEQPIPGVRVVGLGEHVDYWNYLGWRDRFSSSRYSDRQVRYRAEAFPSSAVYTPQAVVDGSIEAVGSDAAALRSAVVRAARAPKAPLRLEARRSGHGLAVHVEVPESPVLKQPADLLVAVVEDGLSTAVERGENAGRKLEDPAVVRRLETVARIEPGSGERAYSRTVPAEADWKLDRVEVVAFLQDPASRRVLGLATSSIPRAAHPADRPRAALR